MQLHKWQPVFPQRAALAGEELLTAVATAVPLLPLVPAMGRHQQSSAPRCQMQTSSHLIFPLLVNTAGR